MDNKLRRYAKIASNVYSNKGAKALLGAAASKTKYACLPTFYSNNVLSGFCHPKLKTVFLELTNKCNLRCKMCNWQAREKTGFISESLFKSCIDQLSEMNLDILNLQFGGESLIHPNFKDFLKYAIKKRDEGKIGAVGWTTNGMLFNQNVSDLVVSLKVDWVNFSLDGLGKVNDEIRLGSKYSIIEKNIKYLLEKRGSSKKPKVLINMVDHGKTEEQKMEFFDAWVPFVDEIELLPSIQSDNTWENKDFCSKNLKLYPPPAFCDIPLNTMIISWEGKVTFCCFDTNFRTILGDANKEPLKKIWNGTKYRNVRKAVLTNKSRDDSPCYGCEFWKVNFEHRSELILNGKAKMNFGYIYRRIQKAT